MVVQLFVCVLMCVVCFVQLCFVLAALFSFDVAGLFVGLLGFWSLSLFSVLLLHSSLFASRRFSSGR